MLTVAFTRLWTGCAEPSHAEDHTRVPADRAAVEATSQALTATSARSEWSPIAQEWSFHRKNRSSYGRVSPLFKCIDKNKDGTFTAHFGYKTANKDVTLPVGRYNGFLPAPLNRGQPTVFKKNTNSNDTFTVKSSSKLLAWFLHDDLVVATAFSKVCATQKVCQASCDDENPCTVDSCSKSTGFQCSHVNAKNGVSCGDGDVCNGSEVCQAPASGSASICTPGTALVCDDDNACTSDSCNTKNGCTHGAKPSGSVCTPEAACTTAGTCNGAGSCLPASGKDCDDHNPCTADSCDATNGCTHAPIAAGTACNDDNACNGLEQCNGAGSCLASAPLVCNDQNECTADTCNPSLGCVFNPVPNEGKVCTAAGCGGAICSVGVCTPKSGVVCDDNNPCTVDVCNGDSCSNVPAPVGKACGDAEFCNGEEQCDGAGSCVAGQLPCQGGDNACSTTSCDSAAGKCVTSNRPDGTACGDSNVCTLSSECFGGSCSRLTADTCNSGWGPGDQSACDASTGCTLRPACAPFFNGGLCEPLDPNSPPGTCIYRKTLCAPEGEGKAACYERTCDASTGACIVNPTSNRNDLCNTDACEVPPGGCVNNGCVFATCQVPRVEFQGPNCEVGVDYNFSPGAGSASNSTCQLVEVTNETNTEGCESGVGPNYVPIDCSTQQPPAPCMEYYEDPSLEGCCALRPKVCRATDFGLPAGTSGYTFSCDVDTNRCVATRAL